MVRREGRMLEGLWEPPGVELSSRESARAALGVELGRLGVSARLAPTGGVVRHRITHREFTVEIWRGERARAVGRSAGLRWVDPEAAGVAITALARKLGRARASADA